MSVSLLQGITKDWEHADFELVKKSANTLPPQKLATEFCIFEFECFIQQSSITDQDTFGLGFTVDFAAECDVGVKIRSVSDGFKYVSVTPQFPMSLRSTRYGKSKPKPVPCPLKEIDVLVAVGDSEINGDDSDSSLLKKVMFEKFKLSRTDPSAQGAVRCRFGRVLTYQDALEQFELLVTLPILLIGVTPQDLLEVTDLTSLRQQVSPMSTPDRKRLAGMGTYGYKSPHRLISPSSTPDRQKGITMDLRDRLGSGAEAALANKPNIDMRSRFASRAAEVHETTVTPNRSTHSVSAKSRMAASPKTDLPPKMSADAKGATAVGAPAQTVTQPAAVLPSSSTEKITAAVSAVAASHKPKEADIAPQRANPFFIPSPSKDLEEKRAKKEKKVSYAAAAAAAPISKLSSTSTEQSHTAVEAPKEKQGAASGVMFQVICGVVILLGLWILVNFLASEPAPDAPAFTDKPVSLFQTSRIFADPAKDYRGLLAPDIIIAQK